MWMKMPKTLRGKANLAAYLLLDKASDLTFWAEKQVTKPLHWATVAMISLMGRFTDWR